MEISNYYISRLPIPSPLFTFTHHCLLIAAVFVLRLETAPRYLESRVALRQSCPSAAVLYQSLAFSTELGDMTALPSLLSFSLGLL